MPRRTLFTIITLILILVAPYWLYVPVLLLGVVLLPLYWEGIVFGFIIDVLYGEVAHTGLSFNFPFAMGIALVLVCLTPFKKHLRINA